MIGVLAFLALLVHLSAGLACSGGDRLVDLKSPDPFQRGVTYGRLCGREMEEVWTAKKAEYKGNVTNWLHMAQRTVESIKQYAPAYYQELLGIQSTGVSMDALLCMATEYEAEFLFDSIQPPSGCSGFAMMTPTGGIVSGQNNDDHRTIWNNGRDDLVLKLNDQVMVYTHAGFPAYMGINSAGISLLWFYVDSGDRNFTALPTTVFIRTLLADCQSLQEVLEFFRQTPLSVPNAWIVTEHGSARSLIVEASPQYGMEYVEVSQEATYGVHTNNVLYNYAMWQNELRPKSLDIGHKSINRMRIVTQMLLNSTMAERGVPLAQQILTTPPTVYNVATLASLVFDANSAMHVLFYGNASWACYSLSGSC